MIVVIEGYDFCAKSDAILRRFSHHKGEYDGQATKFYWW